MEAPEGFVYVAVKTGVSDDDYTQIVSGIQEGETPWPTTPTRSAATATTMTVAAA